MTRARPRPTTTDNTQARAVLDALRLAWREQGQLTAELQHERMVNRWLMERLGEAEPEERDD
jgi:hypothetical protein